MSLRTVLASPSFLHYRFLLVALVGVLVVFAAPVQGQVNEDLKLLPSDGAPGHEFGYSVAIDNGVIAVGARFDDDNGANSGSAYLFDAATGSLLVKLLPTDGAASDEFGFSIDIDNGIAAVGALWADDNGITSGAAYLFDAATGVQLHKLLPTDGAAGDEFGHGIAIDNGIVAVGAKRDDDNGDDSGSLYLFDASTGAQIDKLLPSDGAAINNFGEAVAMDNGIVAVGAHGHSHDGLLIFPGAAYLFDVATGSQIAELLADDAQSNNFFGSAIAIDNSIVAVGAWAKSIVFDHSGAAYVFDAATGSQIVRLVPDDTRDRQHFGISIAVDNGIVAVGAEGDLDTGFEAGAAYLFDVSSGSETDKLLASDGDVFDQLGGSIAFDNGVVAVGAAGDDDDAGSVYLYGSPDGGGNCLDLVVDHIVTGEQAIVTLSGGTPGAKAITAWGTKSGETTIDRGGYCSTFGIKGVKKNRIISGFNRVFDAKGLITFGVDIPGNLSGRQLLFQSAEHGTCPDECMSNLVDTVVE